MPRLRLVDVSKKFTSSGVDTWALKHVSLDIAQGEFVAVEGPSGAGKSTLLNILGLLDAPSSGEYLIDGVNTGDQSALEIARRRSTDFSFVFQSFHLLKHRPVIDSVELGLMYRKVPEHVRRRQALLALGHVGLEDKAGLSANKLSGGEQQRVAIARALAAKSPVIVADEPTGNLDSKNSEAIVENLRILHATGCTVILVTHSAEVAAAADRRIKVVDGQIVSDSGCTDVSPYIPAGDEIVGEPSKVSALDVIRDALASVFSRLGRSLMLVAAVAIGVGLSVATLGISATAAVQVNSTFNAHTNKDVTARWSGYDLRKDLTPGQQATMTRRLGELAGVTSATKVEDLDQQQVTLGVNRGTYKVDVQAVAGQFEAAARVRTTWAPGHSHTLGAGETLAGKDLVKSLEIGPIEGSPLIKIGGRPYMVVGTITDSPRDVTYLGDLFVNSSAGQTINKHPALGVALIRTVAGAAGQVAKQTPLVVDPYNPTKITMSAPADPSTLRNQIESAIQLTLIVVTLIAIVGAVVGLANAMILAVVERRQEFGLRRAIGARSVHILSQTITESAIIGLAGGIIGLAIGLGSVLVITIAHRWAPTFDLTLAPLAVIGGILVGALGGCVASIQAARVRPSDALRL